MPRSRTRVRRRDGTSCSHYDDEPCARCIEDRQRPISFPAIQRFEPTVYEHLFEAGEPMYPISSRQQLLEECVRRGSTSHLLRDSGIFPDQPKRWF